MNLITRMVNRILGNKYRVFKEGEEFGVIYVPDRFVVKQGLEHSEAEKLVRKLNEDV